MNIKFFDNYFKSIFLAFWFIVWYKWVIISTYKIDLITTTIFIVYCLTYIVLFYFNYNKLKIKNITFKYQLSIIISFVFSLENFMFFPNSILLLILKTISTLICIYISHKMLFEYKIEEGLVGIISSFLLLVITLLY
mgnify:FL=1